MAEVAIARERVEHVMREILGTRHARLKTWEVAPLAYLSVLPGRGLFRVSGMAVLDSGRGVRWSTVVKQIGAPHTSGEREIHAYRSGLLQKLVAPLRAPRLYCIEDAPDGSTWLWLEDVQDRYARRWPLEQFGCAAHDLGVFNGAFLTSRTVPRETWLNPWLQQMWVDQLAETDATPTYRADIEHTLRLPQVRRHFDPRSSARIVQLLENQPRFKRWLARLPETLCHHDAALANLFAVGGHTVAVDWEKIGPGPVGVEIATLTFGTLRRCEFDAAHLDELDRSVFDGYVAGLREAGWQGPAEQVRLGYLAAIALRWTVVAGILRMLVEGTQPVRTSPGTHVSADAVLEQRVRLTNFVLACADEARALAPG